MKFKVLRGWNKYIGLMFKKTSPPLAFLLYKKVNNCLHSFFVRFPFKAIWLDENYNIIDQKIVMPWTSKVCCKKPYYILLEIPI